MSQQLKTKLQIRTIIAKLQADRTHKWPEISKKQAPHKSFLLLSVLDGVEQGWIQSNNISLDDRLITQFGAYWQAVMGERVPTIANPFFYIKSSGIWELHYRDGSKPITSPSVHLLRSKGAFAVLDQTFYDMAKDPMDRAILRGEILQNYFSDEGAERITLRMRFDADAYLYASEIDTWVNTPFELISSKENLVTYTVTKEVRDWGFTIKIRDLYKSTCAICQSRVVTPNGYTLVDAAHVWPRSISRNDDPRNGMALCKTHHWMFDQYLLSVTPEYRIRISPWLKSNGQNVDETLQLDGSPITLPADVRYKPAPIALNMHYGRFLEVPT